MKLIYNNNGLYMEAEITTEEEFKQVKNWMSYIIKDLGGSSVKTSKKDTRDIAKTQQNATVYPQQYDEPEPVYPDAEEYNNDRPVVELASDGQRRYMDKLGIPWNETTTKQEAIKLLDDYKRAHGMIGRR